MEWVETAKRLAAHPKWKWQKLIQFIDVDGCGYVIEESYEACHMNAGSEAYPDLEHWPTVGVLLGMVAAACSSEWPVPNGGFWLPSLYSSEFNTWFVQVCKAPHKTPWKKGTYPLPGQALAELLLELWGDE